MQRDMKQDKEAKEEKERQKIMDLLFERQVKALERIADALCYAPEGPGATQAAADFASQKRKRTEQ